MSMSRVCKIIAWLTPTYQLYRMVRRMKKKRGGSTSSFDISRAFDGVFLLIAVGLTAARFLVEAGDTDCCGGCLRPLFCLCLLIQISRSVEIPFAFLSDAIDKLNPESRSDHGNTALRVELSVFVYFETLLNYALICATLPAAYWNCPADCIQHWSGSTAGGTLSIFNSVYYSTVTLTTLGYGDIQPTHALSKLLSMTEVLTSFVIVIMSIAVYASGSQDRSQSSSSGGGAGVNTHADPPPQSIA